MKKLLSITMLLMFAIVAHAQEDVTKFLGIPVDGSKTEMIRKLKEKGYQLVPDEKDVLEGEFNGYDVHIWVVTNNNKVYRIMVVDANAVDERSIQIRFNNLCEQFNNNPKYFSLQDCTISDKEEIFREIFFNKKRYQAIFYQLPLPLNIDTMAVKEKAMSFLSAKYTEQQLANPTEEIQLDIIEHMSKYMKGMYLKKSVWFMISQESYGQYRILMFYDNEYNCANGEDL